MPMKVFLSHKMSGLSDQEVGIIRLAAIHHLRRKYGVNNVSFIDNFHHNDAPVNAGRLWHLGRSIQQLQDADAIYFIPGKWMKAKGCWVELLISFLYKIKRLK